MLDDGKKNTFSYLTITVLYTIRHYIVPYFVIHLKQYNNVCIRIIKHYLLYLDDWHPTIGVRSRRHRSPIRWRAFFTCIVITPQTVEGNVRICRVYYNVYILQYVKWSIQAEFIKYRDTLRVRVTAVNKTTYLIKSMAYINIYINIL